MKIYKSFTCILLSLWAVCTTNLLAQNGDQILDGIGETGLIARYLFNGDTKDWSRNNLHGIIKGKEAKFIKDDLFGNVLSLSADSKSYVSLPNDIPISEESISITGWIYLNSKQSGQRFFDFGKNANSHFFVAPMGAKNEENFLTEIDSESGEIYKTNSPIIEINKWTQITIVINSASKSMSTYINGKLIKESKNIELELRQLFDTNSVEKNVFNIGKSIANDGTYLNASLHDFRIYRIPLTEKQIIRIYRNGLKIEETVVNETKGPVDDLQLFPKTNPQLYNQYLTSVPDIKVETVVGYLPRLPRFVKGTYSNEIKETEIRVIWPSPIDNSDVLKPGRYIITGSIAGTELKPKAIVTVKENANLITPKRNLEVFNLDQVTLNSDIYGKKTKFIENRDKFITTLAETNPDSFLYMFRNAFGQEQPQGSEPLGVWDTQETKLRGHATGHYLTAIAQAYASTNYDKTLHTNFADKMDYMVNTLYRLSQMSGQPKETGGD